jgi:hypothetical protein
MVRAVLDAYIATWLAARQENLLRLRLPTRFKEAVLLGIDPSAKLALDQLANGKVMRVARERTVRVSRCRRTTPNLARM